MTENIYQNETYKVVFNPELEGDDNYEVISNKYGVTEVREKTLPGALSIAEQMHRIMKYNLWEEYAKTAYPDPNDNTSLFGGADILDFNKEFPVDEDNDDGDGIH